MMIGSPEWFYEKSTSREEIEWKNAIEESRLKFLQRFSPELLVKMDGSTLLQNVFGRDDSSMIRLLMFDDEYRWFGATGKYSYLGIIYYDQSKETWKYNKKNN